MGNEHDPDFDDGTRIYQVVYPDKSETTVPEAPTEKPSGITYPCGCELIGWELKNNERGAPVYFNRELQRLEGMRASLYKQELRDEFQRVLLSEERRSRIKGWTIAGLALVIFLLLGALMVAGSIVSGLRDEDPMAGCHAVNESMNYEIFACPR